MRLKRCVAWRGAGVDGRDGFVEIGAGVTDRHAMARRHERLHQLDAAGQLRREGDDADVGASRRR